MRPFGRVLVFRAHSCVQHEGWGQEREGWGEHTLVGVLHVWGVGRVSVVGIGPSFNAQGGGGYGLLVKLLAADNDGLDILVVLDCCCAAIAD